MQFVEAFNLLGYDVPNPGQDWSAEKADGICITLWKQEIEWVPPSPRMNLFERAKPGTSDWERFPGHHKRTTHLKRAVSGFEGLVDVIVVRGTPGKATAMPTRGCQANALITVGVSGNLMKRRASFPSLQKS